MNTRFIITLLGMHSAGAGAALALLWLLLQVPDSTFAFLLLSLALVYFALFTLSFTLAAVTGAVGEGPDTFRWSGLAGHGRRGWWRVAAVLLAAGGTALGLFRVNALNLYVAIGVVLLALLAVPAVVQGARWSLDGAARAILLALGSLGLGVAAWKLLDAPVEMSRPWLEFAYLGARVLVAFLLFNLSSLLVLAGGSALLKPAVAPQPAALKTAAADPA